MMGAFAWLLKFILVRLFAEAQEFHCQLQVGTTHSTVALPESEEEAVDVVFVQFDTRDPRNDSTPEFIKVLTAWNAQYTRQFAGHRYVLFTTDLVTTDSKEGVGADQDPDIPADCDGAELRRIGAPIIVGPQGCLLHAVWGKVLAMRKAQEMYPNARYFAFFDSDAVVNYEHDMMNVSLPLLFEKIEDHYGSNRSFYVTMDIHSFFTRLVLYGSPFTKPIISGTVFWRRSPEATKVLDTWWRSALDNYTIAEFPSYTKYLEDRYDFAFRQIWPRDQDRLNAIVNDPYYRSVGSLIQVVPELDRKQLIRSGHIDPGVCARFEYLVAFDPERGCFATHFTNDQVRAVEQYNGRAPTEPVDVDSLSSLQMAKKGVVSDAMQQRVDRLKALLTRGGRSLESLAPTPIVLE